MPEQPLYGIGWTMCEHLGEIVLDLGHGLAAAESTRCLLEFDVFTLCALVTHTKKVVHEFDAGVN